MVWIISHVTIVGILVSNLFHMSVADSECFACVRPANCAGRTCDIVGGCGEGVPVGYYPDLTKANSYCYCTGTAASSRYETCHPASLLWDTHQQGNNYYLEGNWGKDGLWGTNGGGCSWNWQVSNKGNDRPGIDGNPIVTDFSVDPDGNVCGTQIIESPTNSPTESPTASTIVSSPTEEPSTLETSSPQQCEDNLGNIVANTLDKNTWTTLTNGFPLFTDDGVNVMVAGDFTSQAGAELEGASVTLGDFHVKGSGLGNVGVVGAGSLVVPSNGKDSWIVGGNLKLDRTVQYMNGNVLIGGSLSGAGSIGSIGSGTVQQGANIDIDGYETMFAELKTKADYWASLPANGEWELKNGNTLEFRATNNDVLQVFSISGDNLNYNLAILVRFHPNLANKTILINVDSNSAKKVVVKNLANFYDPDGNSHWSFKTKHSANILWNFHDAMTVDIGGGGSGNGEFTGSIIVPTPGSTVTMRFPGSSGRFIVNGNAIQNRAGHEFHNFPFQPPEPLPLPNKCDAPIKAEPTTLAPTTLSPTTRSSTTLAPTTRAPTTLEPTTRAPATLAPTTHTPTTLAPTTRTPTTLAPTTRAPTTLAPTARAPTALAPTTQAPTALAPTTQAPITLAPTTQAPILLPTSQPTQETIQGASGDPHFKTWSGERYDYHGICDLILLSNPKFKNNIGMDIYIRSKKTKQWSYISTAVIRIGDETFEVSGRKDGDTHWINGIRADHDGDNIIWNKGTHIAGYPILYQSLHSNQREYVINLGENSEKIVFKTWKDFVRVDVLNPRDENFIGSLGLMGSYPDGKSVGRLNSVTEIKDKNVFGQEWQAHSSDPQLFHSVEGPQYPSKCVLPSKSSLRRRLSKSLISREEAEILCLNISDKEERNLCIFDVMATNDGDIAGSY